MALGGSVAYGADVAEADKAEKITVNLGLVDLGRIDLLVDEGFYSNRTDFIRTAVRRQLAADSEAVEQTVRRRTLVLGAQRWTRAALEELQAAGEVVHIRVLGLVTIDADVTAELATQTIASVEVLGAFRAAPAVRAALAPRIT